MAEELEHSELVDKVRLCWISVSYQVIVKCCRCISENNADTTMMSGCIRRWRSSW